MEASTGTPTVREHDGMKKTKGLLATLVGTLAFEGELEPWNHKPAQDGRPEMWRSKVNGVEIWAKEVDPSTFVDGKIVGVLEIKNSTVNKGNDAGAEYLYVNVLPLPEGAVVAATVSILPVPKVGEGKGRRRVLPDGYNEETDYMVERYGQPWQVVTVRETSAPAA